MSPTRGGQTPRRRQDRSSKGLLARFRRHYGASPLHLLALLASLLITGAAMVRWFDAAASDTLRIVLWFAGAIVAHDLVLLPLYSALDQIALGRRDLRPPGLPTTVRERSPGWVYIRVPAMLSGLILLVFAAEILRLGDGTFHLASGSHQDVYLSRYLVTCGALFALSGLVYALSLARARRRRLAAHTGGGSGAPKDQAPWELAARAAIVTISTSKATSGDRDESGARLAMLAERLGVQIAGQDLIPDERPLIEERLRHWADVEHCELILTTGGTGLSPTDVTPEATRAVIEREAPGIPHAIREASRTHTSYWMLSRAVAGTRGASLIVNFPGNPASIDQAGGAIADALTHALALIAGRPSGH
jgi:molybdopterin adenylyltransferase